MDTNLLPFEIYSLFKDGNELRPEVQFLNILYEQPYEDENVGLDMRDFLSKLFANRAYKKKAEVCQSENRLKFELERSKRLIKSMENCMNLANSWQDKKNRVYYFERIKKEIQCEWVICEIEADNTIKIYSPHPNLNSDLVLTMFINHDKKAKTFEIIDIQISETDCSKGYGSVAMKYLFRLVTQLDIERITGKQYYTDDLNRARQEYFYKKHNFIINNGRIYWESP